MDSDLDLSLDDGGLGSAQNIDDLSLVGAEDDGLGIERTPEQIALAEKLANDPATLKAKIAALEAEKITSAKDVEIAQLKGRLEAGEEFRKVAPTAPAAKVYTEAELAKMNEQLVAELSTNPLAALQRVRELAKADAIAEMQAQASPAMGTAGQMVVKNFLTRMSKSIEPKWYALAEKEFHAETSTLDPAGLLTLPVADRSKILQRFWDAALGRVTATMLSRKQVPQPRNMGGGTSGGGGNQATGIKRLAQALGYTEIEAQRYLKASKLTLKEALDAIAS